MPITLTTPVDTGDLDGIYNKVRIAHFDVDINLKSIRVQIQYGRMEGSNWHSAAMRLPKDRNFRIRDADFDTLVANSQSSASGELVYDLVAANLYQWLIDQGHIVGTVDT